MPLSPHNLGSQLWCSITVRWDLFPCTCRVWYRPVLLGGVRKRVSQGVSQPSCQSSAMLHPEMLLHWIVNSEPNYTQYRRCQNYLRGVTRASAYTSEIELLSLLVFFMWKMCSSHNVFTVNAAIKQYIKVNEDVKCCDKIIFSPSLFCMAYDSININVHKETASLLTADDMDKKPSEVWHVTRTVYRVL